MAEVVVLLVIAGIVICLLMPALLGARDRKRKLFCQKKMADLILSVQAFESSQGFFPPGVINPDGPIKSESKGMHHGWMIHVLPFLDQQGLFQQVDFSKSIYDSAHADLKSTVVPAFRCPADVGSVGGNSYAACHHDEEAPINEDNRGVFFLNSRISKSDVVDGLAFTLFLGEKRTMPDDNELGWVSGTRSTLRNTGTGLNQSEPKPSPDYVGGFGSWHRGITHLSKGDSSVNASSNQIDPIVYRQLGNRSDGSELTPTNETEEPN